MDKLLKHIPEIDEESGAEHPWSIVIGDIKNKKNEWKEIESLIESKVSDRKKRKHFVKNILNELITIKTERPPILQHDKYGNKEELVSDLMQIKDNIIKLQKSFWHREYHDFLYAQVSKSDWKFEDGINEAAESMEQMRNNLELMKQAAENAIKYYKDKDKLRPNHSTQKRKLKDNLAYFIARELNEIGVRATETRNGIFDKVFCLSCNIIELKPNAAGSQHITRAVNEAKKKTS